MDKLPNRARRYWPCLAAIFLLWSAVATVLIFSLRMNQGHLVLALDDSYILLAMAKNFARHRVWGITPFEFSATSSSPLWTLLNAGLFWAFGVNAATPLILNTLFATLLVIVARRILVSLSPSLPNLYMFVVLVSLLFFSPIVNVIFIGLEHTLHAALTLLFVFYAGRLLAAPKPAQRASEMLLLALGVVLSAVRYEGLLAVGVVAGLLFLQRRIALSAELAVVSLLPALLTGSIAVAHGWFWLPNSVALKGNLPLGKAQPLTSFLAHCAANTVDTGMRVVRLGGVALLLMLWQYAQYKQAQKPESQPPAFGNNQDQRSTQAWMMGIFVATATLHLMLAGTGWFYRYEAYLVALGLTVVAAPLWEFVGSLRQRRRLRLGDGAGFAAVALLLLSANLFWSVGYSSLRLTPLAMHDTFRWHYQMGSFVARYYQGSSLVVNDIGAVNFLADIHCTDPHGLADREIGRALLHGQHTSEFLDMLAHSRGAQVALVDDNWLALFGGVPRGWRLAGVWRFQNRVVLAPPSLSFYALDEASQAELIANLREYSRSLPTDVQQLGPYVEQKAKSSRQ